MPYPFVVSRSEPQIDSIEPHTMCDPPLRREDFDASRLRDLARKTKDGPQA